jgi:hypothetical protein
MKITRTFIQDGNRYIFDNGACHFKQGYAQVDTGQEAWYYGLWANAKNFKIVCYAEGDLTVEEYENAEEFATAFREMAERYKGYGWTCRIDTMCSDPIKEAFEACNLSEFFWENQENALETDVE